MNVDDVLDDWGERAGIREFCGGVGREEAEIAAMHETMERWTK